MKKFTNDELKLLSEIDIAYHVLEEKNGMNTLDLYKEVCNILEKNVNEDRIADFFSSLTTDKRFLLLENGNFDLRRKHAVKLVIEDEDDIDEDQLESNPEETEDEDDIDQTEDDPDNLDDSDDLGELVIVDEDELEE